MKGSWDNEDKDWYGIQNLPGWVFEAYKRGELEIEHHGLTGARPYVFNGTGTFHVRGCKYMLIRTTDGIQTPMIIHVPAQIDKRCTTMDPAGELMECLPAS